MFVLELQRLLFLQFQWDIDFSLFLFGRPFGQHHRPKCGVINIKIHYDAAYMQWNTVIISKWHRLTVACACVWATCIEHTMNESFSIPSQMHSTMLSLLHIFFLSRLLSIWPSKSLGKTLKVSLQFHFLCTSMWNISSASFCPFKRWMEKKCNSNERQEKKRKNNKRMEWSADFKDVFRWR